MEVKKQKQYLNSKDLERRFILSNEVEVRAFEEEGKRFLEGYASVFEKRSVLLLENNKIFHEIIQRGAFDEILLNENLDVKFLFNHDRSKMLARSSSGTLSLKADEVGLFFRAEIPMNVSYANDVYELVLRGDLFQNSFAFSVIPNDVVWSKDADGTRLRTIKRVSGLYDVSVVIDAAYPDTSIAARSLKEIEENEVELEKEPIIYKSDSYKRKLEVLKLKLI